MGNSKAVPANTVIDVNRFEQDIAALTPNHQITPLNFTAIAPWFGNGYLGTWTLGFGTEMLPTDRSHSTYHALQTSLMKLIF